jgi:hypothetical protein
MIWVLSVGPRPNLQAARISGITSSIGRNAFDRCSGLTSVSIPAGVTSIDWGIFRFCTGLTSISVDPANPAYSSTADGKALLNKAQTLLVQAAPGLMGNYSVPAGITRLNTEAFYGCTGMTGITLPSGLNTIDGYVFGGCSVLTSISIPASVTSISNGPFYYCTNLKTVAVSEDGFAPGPASLHPTL